MDKICPMMSKADFQMSGGVWQVTCQREKCALWVPFGTESYEKPKEFGHCGLIRGE